MGSPKELFSADGECLWQAEHSLWGSVSTSAKQSGSAREVGCDLRFQGQWEDAESGLYYNYQRYYDPEIGQYLSPDPIGLVGGTRTYGYVHNPLMLADPYGLSPSDRDSPEFLGEGEEGAAPYMYPGTGEQSNTVWIRMQGSRGRDATEAFRVSKIPSNAAKGYTWHHTGKLNRTTGYVKMQLLLTKDHGSMGHDGPVADYEEEFNIEKYGDAKSRRIAEMKGWRNCPP